MTGRKAARLVLLAGGLGLAFFLFERAPRDVVLVYDLARVPGATAVDVEIRRGPDLVRRAELSVPPGAEPQLRHAVRLPDGDYALVLRVDAPAGPVRKELPLEIREEGTIVLPLAR